jgi:hypothetical protein
MNGILNFDKKLNELKSFEIQNRLENYLLNEYSKNDQIALEIINRVFKKNNIQFNNIKKFQNIRVDKFPHINKECRSDLKKIISKANIYWSKKEIRSKFIDLFNNFLRENCGLTIIKTNKYGFEVYCIRNYRKNYGFNFLDMELNA